MVSPDIRVIQLEQSILGVLLRAIYYIYYPTVSEGRQYLRVAHMDFTGF